MSSKFFVAAAVAAGLVISAGSADAQRPNEPKKANKYSSTMVRSYDSCALADNNDLTAGGLPLPACAPAVPSDGMCTLEAGKAAAKVDIKEKKGEFEGSLKVTKIQGCDGEELCAAVSSRVTTQNCNSGDPNGCTVALEFTETGTTGVGFDTQICCTIDKGNCKAKIALNTALGSAVITAGNTTAVAVGNVTLIRTGGGAFLSAGVLSN